MIGSVRGPDWFMTLFFLNQFVGEGGLPWLAAINVACLILLLVLAIKFYRDVAREARRWYALLFAPIGISLVLVAGSGIFLGRMQRANEFWFHLIDLLFLAVNAVLVGLALWHLPKGRRLLAVPIVVIEVWFALWAHLTWNMALRDTWL